MNLANDCRIIFFLVAVEMTFPTLMEIQRKWLKIQEEQIFPSIYFEPLISKNDKNFQGKVKDYWIKVYNEWFYHSRFYSHFRIQSGGKCIECNAESSFCQEDVQKLSEKFQKTHFSLMLPLMSHENQVESQASLQFGSVNF